MFISNKATCENAWRLTGDEPMLSEGRNHDDVNHKSQADYIRSFNTTTVSDQPTR